MKTKIILLTLLVTLGSCAEEVIGPGGGNEMPRPIGFTARKAENAPSSQAENAPSSQGALTRGTPIETAGEVAGAGGFDVWTWSHTGNWDSAPADAAILIENPAGAGYARVTNPGGAGWNYGTPVYWPVDRNVTSFAIAPADAAAAPGSGSGAPGYTMAAPAAGGVPTVTYNLPSPGPGQYDLMFAAPQKDLTYASYGGVVPENFHHALSQVAFRAFKDPALAGSTVVVTGITLKGVHTTGTAALSGPAVWTSTSGNATFDFTGGQLNPAATTVTATDAAGATAPGAQGLLNPDPASVGVLFLLPQPLAGVTLEVTYTVDGGAPQTKAVPLPSDPTSLAPGRRYTLLIAIEGEAEDGKWSFTEDGVITVSEAGYYWIEAWGGDGGEGGDGIIGSKNWAGGSGGEGSYYTGLFQLTTGQTLYVQVGGRGADGITAQGTDGAGAGGTASYFGSGGKGGRQDWNSNPSSYAGGGGGGGAASGVYVNGTVWLAAAGGGGGGGGGGWNDWGSNGGDGGQNGINGGDGIVWLPPVSYNPSSGAGGTGGGSTEPNGNGSNGPSVSQSNLNGGGGGGGGGYNATGNGGGGVGAKNSDHGGGGGGGSGANYRDPVRHVPTPAGMQAPPPGTRPAGWKDGYVIVTYLGPTP